jgi:hypothetical protein
MIKNLVKIGGVAALLLAPIGLAQAQGVIRGEEKGAAEGARDAGPVGAVVGGAVGAVTGGVAGLLGVDERPHFHEYVMREHPHSYDYRYPVRVGTILPEQGFAYYAVPPEFPARGYDYTVVNNETVLVDPRTHRVVQIIE